MSAAVLADGRLDRSRNFTWSRQLRAVHTRVGGSSGSEDPASARAVTWPSVEYQFILSRCAMAARISRVVLRPDRVARQGDPLGPAKPVPRAPTGQLHQAGARPRRGFGPWADPMKDRVLVPAPTDGRGRNRRRSARDRRPDRSVNGAFGPSQSDSQRGAHRGEATRHECLNYSLSVV